MPEPTKSPQSAAAAATIDVAAIVFFVILGRSSHHESGSFVVSTLKVATPFLASLAAGWFATRAWRYPTSPSTGVGIWLVTAAGGMLARRFVLSRSTAFAFVIVGSVFTLFFLVGWRFLAEWIIARRPTDRAKGTTV